ncbi:hypothetical protein BKA23_0154 [Rudaeicoccus suwonensis]|uniref:Uncharacterized protein n=1 Tax=Rudaeicoccus suwonensis TaxID=657409 RepID=A0A561E708_9MICO|nr:hypothetical protein BKA23_0154 [Rudaeicoccus suwonensis]
MVFDMSGMCEQQPAEPVEIVGASAEVPGAIGQALSVSICAHAPPLHTSGRGDARRRRPSAIGKLGYPPCLSSDLLRIV